MSIHKAIKVTLLSRSFRLEHMFKHLIEQ